MKKIILSALLATSVLGIFSCVRCEDVLEYVEIKSVIGKLYDTEKKALGDVISQDSVVVEVNLSFNYIADNKLNLSLINSMYANTCRREGESGFKDEVVAVKFYSSVAYLGVPAGDTLNLRTNEEALPHFLNSNNSDRFEVYLDSKQAGDFDLTMSVSHQSGTTNTYKIADFTWE